ncbi:MAG: hypothetical protein EPO07_01695 [Verrucomicrobia bacterium]|nr:MAG: hypothetical protein EPO07_01695 [Verrucomicrobiota bacterium]
MRTPKYEILLPNLFCVVLLTGCAAWPYNDKHLIAVRPGNGTNIVERLFQSDTGIASWALLQPCYAGGSVTKDAWKFSYFIEDQSGRRTRIESLTFLKKHCEDYHTYHDTLWRAGYYDVRAVMKTNLWLALSRHSSNYRGGPSHRSEYDLSFHLYVFDPHTIIRDREWKAIPWPQNGTNVEFRFGAGNQQITYSTTQGFETYDLLQDTVSKGSGDP